MSREIKEIYKCDRCKQEVDDIRNIFIPYQVEETGEVSFISRKLYGKRFPSKKFKFEICHECAKQIVESDRAKNSDWVFQIIEE